MKHRIVHLVAAAACILYPSIGRPLGATSLPNEQDDRLAAAFVLALGRVPTNEEAVSWRQQGALTIAELLTRLRAQLASDSGMQRAVVLQACRDGFGRAPTDDESRAWFAGETVRTYTELMQRHVQTLRDDPARYERVILRVYPRVVRREAYAEEIRYWRKRDALPYSLLVACVENWARRNQPGLMVTSGTPTVSVNSEFLTTVRLSPAMAAEARAAVGLVPGGEATHAPALGRNLIAAGAEDIATAGRMHVVAAGASD